MISYQKLEEVNIEELKPSSNSTSSTHVIKDKLNKEKNLLEKSNYIKNIKLIILLLLTHLTIWLIATPNNTENVKTELLKIHLKNLEFKGIYESGKAYVDLYDENFMLILKNKQLIYETSSNSEKSIYQILISQSDTSKIFHFIDKKTYAFPTGFIVPKNISISKVIKTNQKHTKKSFDRKLNHFQKDWEL